MVVNFEKKVSRKKGRDVEMDYEYVVDVLLNCDKKSVGPQPSMKIPRPAKPDEESDMVVVPILLELIKGMSSVRLFMPKDLRPPDSRRSILRAMEVNKYCISLLLYFGSYAYV